MTTRPLLSLAVASGMLQAAPPSFDAATLKPVKSTGETYRANLGTARHGEVTLTNVTLSDCLRYAYGITDDAQIQGPDWIRNKEVRFDIFAKAPPGTALDQLLLMLQTLLAERFHLGLHRELKELPFLALTVGKKGPKLPAATDASDSSPRISIPGRIISNRMTLRVLTTLLSRFMRQTVLDMTGLNGSYEVSLVWTPGNLHPAPDADAPPGPSIFTAIQEQLGLKLESRKSPVEVLVIDRADQQPLEN